MQEGETGEGGRDYRRQSGARQSGSSSRGTGRIYAGWLTSVIIEIIVLLLTFYILKLFEYRIRECVVKFISK